MLDDFTNDANLGSVSDTAKVIIGDLKGVYFEMEWKQTNEPTIVVMNLILIDKKSSDMFSIAYQYFDNGEDVLYDKESFLASIK